MNFFSLFLHKKKFAGVFRDAKIGQGELDESFNIDEARAIIKTDVDPLAWDKELERVSSRLKESSIYGSSTLRGAEIDSWRSHVEITRTQHQVFFVLSSSRPFFFFLFFLFFSFLFFLLF